MTPFEILAAPFEAWLAPVGEAFPIVNAAPAGNWAKIGTSGARNYGEDGVTVTHEQEVEEFRMLGAVGPVKASRTSEGLIITFVLHDVSLEQYSKALDYNTVTTVPGPAPGYKHVGLSRGLTLDERALLLRSDFSPYGDAFKMQYEVPRVFMRSSPAPVYAKGAPAGLEFEFVALEDAAASELLRFGRLVAQHVA